MNSEQRILELWIIKNKKKELHERYLNGTLFSFKDMLLFAKHFSSKDEGLLASQEEEKKIITGVICEFWDLTEEELIGDSRLDYIIEARHVYWKTFIDWVYCSSLALSRAFDGKPESSTIRSAMRKFKNPDKRIARVIELVNQRIENRLKR